MKKTCTNIALLIFFTITFFPIALSSQHLENQISQNQLLELARDRGEIPIIVEFNMPFRSIEHHSPEILAQQRAQIAITAERIIERYSFVEAGNVQRYSNLPLMAFMADEAAIRALLTDSDIRTVFKNELSAPSMDVSNAIIGSPVVWDAGVTGEGTVVAVLDTGVDSSHPHFGDRVIAEVCYSSAFDPSASSLCPGGATSAFGPGAADDCDFDNISGCGHGTHVAGTVAGSSVISGRQIQGVAKDAAIIAMQVFSRFDHTQTTICDSGSTPATRDCVLTYLSDQLAALNWLYDERSNYNLVAANMSLGGGGSTTPCDWDSRKAAMDNLKAVNIATIVASGNNGFSNGISSPACISTAISVGSTQTAKYNNLTTDNISSFSNSAHFLDLLAPGQFIENARPGNRYQAIAGTSMAAPHVSGAWALYRQAFPNASVDDVLAALQDHGQLITDPRNAVTTARIQIDQTMLNAVTTAEISEGAGDGYRFLASPIETSYASFLENLWTQGAIESNHPESDQYNIFTFNGQNTNGYDPFTGNLSTETLNRGESLLVYVFARDAHNEPQETWPKILNVTGIPSFSDFNASDILQNKGMNDANMFNLIGNPFSDAIRFGDFSNVDKSGLRSQIWVYDHNYEPVFPDAGEGSAGSDSGGGWRAYLWNGESGAGSLTNGVIAPFQAFFMRNTNTITASERSLTLTADMQQGDETMLYNERNEGKVVQLVSRINNSQMSDIWLAFAESATVSAHNMDLESLYPLDYRAFLSMYIEADGSAFDIKNLPSELTEPVHLPLHIYGWQPNGSSANPGFIPMGGSVEIIWPTFDNIPADRIITLTDNETGAVINLRDADRYEFEMDASKSDRFLEHKLAIRSPKLTDKSASRFTLTITPEQPTDIPADDQLPRAVALAQNYPNPFNPVTQIRFELPESSDVRLDVFNIQGQRVATVVNETRSAGTHTVSFDASTLASGVYLYRLQAGSQVFTKKMTLLK